MKTTIQKHNRLWAVLLFGLAAIAVALRGSSLWPDEGLTYGVISVGFSDFIRSMIDLSAGSAHCGMPLYMLLEWIWIHVFGESELAMRASNVLFMIPYLVYAGKSLKKLNLSPWYMALFALNSVFLFYLNDARPYTMLLSMGMGFFYYAMLCDLNDSRVLNGMHLFFFLGMSTHMMFLFIFFAYLTRCLFLLVRRKINVRLQFMALLRFLIAYIPLAAYYLYVFTHATEVSNWRANSAMCVAQILYYMAGFGGLGLNRMLLRDFDFFALESVHVVLIALMVLAYAGMLLYLIVSLFGKGGKKESVPEDAASFPVILTGFLASMLLFFAANIFIDTLFWERHCIWLLAFILILICLLLDRMFRSGMALFKIFAWLMVVMQLLSAGRAMLDPYYAKEDYKGLVSYFETLDDIEDSIVVFQGSDKVFAYYGWTGANRDGSAADMTEAVGKKLQVNHFTVDGLQSVLDAYPGTYYLVLSQKDRFDAFDVYEAYEGDTTFRGFKIVRIEA